MDALCAAGDLAGRRVLDVGCGTGRLAEALAARGSRVWGVDPSPEMLAEARRRCGRSVGLRRAAAEALPFRDAWFERAVAFLVVHLVDRARALPELARVLAPQGRLAIATFGPGHVDRVWLTRFFPSVAALDRARFPDPEALRDELLEAGFAGVETSPLVQEARIAREEALERLRGRFVSTLSLIPEEEFRAGLGRAERELPDETRYAMEWAIVVARR